jgi:hypothetical protein
VSPLVDPTVSDAGVLLATGVVALTFLIASLLVHAAIDLERPTRVDIQPRKTVRFDDEERSEPSGYAICITRRGAPWRPFGWELYQQDDFVKLASSTKTFRTRGEALAASAAAAAPWLLGSR